MADGAGPPEVLVDDRDWYTLREVARALGLSRQAVHARVQKGQLNGERVDGAWRVPSRAVAEAVQAQRTKALLLGSVRLLPAFPSADVDVIGGGDLAERVATIEAVLTNLSEDHRRALAERDRELVVVRERCERLKAALHQMVELLAADPVLGSDAE